MHEPAGTADANDKGGVGGKLPKNAALLPRDPMKKSR